MFLILLGKKDGTYVQGHMSMIPMKANELDIIMKTMFVIQTHKYIEMNSIKQKKARTNA